MLRIEVAQKYFYHALHHVAKAVSSTSPMPILSGIYLEASAAGVILQAGSLGLMLQYELSAEEGHVVIGGSGAVVIPAKYLIEMIRNSDQDGFVTIEAEEGYPVRIQLAKAVYRLNGMNAEEFPRMVASNMPSLTGMSNKLLRAFIYQVAFAVSASEMRPILTGVSCQFDEGHLRFLATDGIKLASRTTMNDDGSHLNRAAVTVPGKHLLQYAKLLADTEATTDITITDHKIMLRTKNFTMQSLLIEGVFPSVDHLTPGAFATVLTVDPAGLLYALERVSLLAGKSSLVRMHLQTAGSIELLSRTAEIGDVVAEVSAEELQEDELTVYFNAAYMCEILRAVECSRITLSFSGPLKPIMIRPVDDSTSLYILTPIRSRL